MQSANTKICMIRQAEVAKVPMNPIPLHIRWPSLSEVHDGFSPPVSNSLVRTTPSGLHTVLPGGSIINNNKLSPDFRPRLDSNLFFREGAAIFARQAFALNGKHISVLLT